MIQVSHVLRLVLVLLMAGLAVQDGWAQQTVYRDAPIRQVIEEIEAATAYRFLYRDALITGKTVSFEAAPEGVLAAFDAALRRHRLRLQIDEARRQVLLVEMPDEKEHEDAAPPVVAGQVMDDQSGARLPFAAITWHDGTRLRGVAANEAGAFNLPLDAYPDDLGFVLLTASYVGYEPAQVRLDLAAPPSALPIRLQPGVAAAPEVVVHSSLLAAALDTTWHDLLRPGLASPLGESNVMRALEALPAVSLTAALAPGLSVRGSRADGFQVLLDGVPIYNQHHFFGLFDVFNEAALQTVGFFYGVAPARLAAPPGGTLTLTTRTGAQTGMRASAGLSNTAYHGTLEGPLLGGRASWLVSGRHSYLNAVDWFNNDALIAQGLDVGRETSALPALSSTDPRTLFPGASSARFYDLHAKLYHETRGGSRQMLTAYAGGDDTRHEQARRFFEQEPDGSTPRRLDLREVTTRNAWGNAAASFHDQRPLGLRRYAHTLLAYSRYYSRFAKDDFVYLRPERPTMGPATSEPFIDGFSNENALTEIKLAQHLDLARPGGATMAAGYSLHRYTTRYEEAAAQRALFDETQRSTQIDLFAEVETAANTRLAVQAGLRGHYFSEGDFVRISPRFLLHLAPQQPLSFSLGYSRNHQFLHRLYLEHDAGSDIWILSTDDEPPGRADHFTAGLYAKPRAGVAFQAEAYYKFYRNLRQHATSAVRRPARDESRFLAPWLHDNTARAAGLELLLRHRLGPLQLTHSYTLARVEVRHPDLADGAYTPAEWDRRHQAATRLHLPLAAGIDLHLTGLFASGAPNTLAFADPAEPERLPRYHRMDARLAFQRRFGPTTVAASAAVFNLYDRANTWYRAPAAVLDPERREDRFLRFVNVDVYDLGLQPSFSIELRW